MSKIDAKILVLDDDQGVLYTSQMILKQYFNHVRTERDPKKLDSLLKETSYDVIVLDMNFSYGLTGGKEGIKLLKKVLSVDPEAHVLMNTAYGDIEIALEAMKEGAIDFLVKPWPKEKLLATVKSIYALAQTKKEVKLLKAGQQMVLQDQQKLHHCVVGKSSKMKPIFDAIEYAADSDANVLILGENGTGKELIAHEIHKRSQRANTNFVKAASGSITESLSEIDLFGYVKGAFTDAKDDKPGKLELANKGTLLLDEIHYLSLNVQAKLLTTLQFMQATRMGSDQVTQLDVRLISTSNISPAELIKHYSFRQDLLQRINTIEIHVPPLRERKEDIEPIARHFLKIYGKKYGKLKMRLNQTTVSKLISYSWPGNVLELQHAVERAVMMANSHLLAPEDFLIPEKPDQNIMTTDSFNIEVMEKQAIQNSIRDAAGNLTKAAKALGFGRSTLYRKMEKYKL